MTDVSIMTAIDTLDSMVEEEPDDFENALNRSWQNPQALPGAKERLQIDNTAKITASVAKNLVSRTTGTLNMVNTATGGSLMGKAGWGALISGASLGAGPIALLVASAALTVVQSTAHAVSAYKTNEHIKNLRAIYAEASSYGCQCQDHNHSHIQNTVLPYIIAQKEKKRVRRMGSAVPVLGSAIEQARAKARASYKWATGSLGKNRTLYAQQLAHHHTCGCDLTSAIIAELFGLSKEEADASRRCLIAELAAVISVKLKSV